MSTLKTRLSIACGALLAVTLLAATAVGHGGTYRGPGGQVPPSGRTPQDPTPPPTQNPGTSGGPGPAPTTPGTTPTPTPGITGGRPLGDPRSAPAPNGTGRATGVTPALRKRTSTLGYERWEFWWAHNQDRFLRIKEKLRALDETVTLSADWVLGTHDRSQSRFADRPTPRAIESRLIPALIERLDDSFFDVRAAAVIALGKTGQASVYPHLVEMLDDTHRQVSESAALAIGILGQDVGSDVLRELVLDTSAGKKLVRRPAGVPKRTRAFAAIGLGLIGNPASVPTLRTAIAERSAAQDVRVCSILALGLLGTDAAEAADDLIALARDPRSDDLVRAHATTTLGRLGNPSVLPVLRRFLRDSSLQVRRSAILALGELAEPTDETSVRYLINEVRKGSDPQSRVWACIALAEIGGPLAEKLLKDTAVNRSGFLQSYGALGLAILARDAGDPALASKYLVEGLAKTRQASTRGAFCIALGILGDRDAAPHLRPLLRHADPGLRGHAAIALGMMNATDTIASIRDLVDVEARDPELQRASATALGLMGDRQVIPVLSKVLRRARAEYVKSSAATALGTIGDHTAIDLLVEVAGDKSGTADLARAHATVALGLVGEQRDLPVLSRVSANLNYRALLESLQELLSIS